MSFDVAEVMAVFMRDIERPGDGDGLGIPAMLGYPDTGRTGPVLPCAALVFSQEDYAGPRTRPRIGQVPPAGNSIVATLYIFARNEPELLRLVDALRSVKHAMASITANAQSLIVRYGPTQRVEMVLQDRVMEYVVATTVTFSGN